MNDQTGDGPANGDDQAMAEALDDEQLNTADTGYPPDYPPDFPPDHAFASEEARVVIGSGDVPQDSVEERSWREEPDVLPPMEGSGIELVEPHPDAGLDPSFADTASGELEHAADDDGESVADGLAYSRNDLSAEEGAVHIVDDRDL